MSTPYDTPSDPAKRQSAALTDGPDRAGARSMLKAAGFTDEDLAKPIIGVGTTWIETMPCNLNQRDLAVHVKRGVRDAGGTPMEFNTIAVSDGVSMGTSGMRASLVSREVIADSIELVARGPSLRRARLPRRLRQDESRRGDGGRAARHPGGRLLHRLDRPGPLSRPRRRRSAMCTRGSARTPPGRSPPPSSTSSSRPPAPAPAPAAASSPRTRCRTILDFLGLSRSARTASRRCTRAKEEAAYETGKLAVELVRDDVTPSLARHPRSRSRTPPPSVAATGGSTNGVLHLVAIAQRASGSTSRSTTSTDLGAHADRRRHEAVGTLARERHAQGRRHRRSWRAS